MDRQFRYLSLFLGLFCLTAQGQSYFQQKVDHEIHVTLDDRNHILRGYELVSYTNNSSDTLQELWFHLWPNAYSGFNTAMNRQKVEDEDVSLNYAKRPQLGWIDSLDFIDSNTPLQFKVGEKNPDIARVELTRPINPGETRKLEIPFRVVIPEAVFSRCGHLDQAYHITQWYPKPAVYDSNGWHPMPNVDQGEYFSEYGNYDVYITLASNYVVGATGGLQTASELEWLSQKNTETRALTEFNLDDLDIPPSSLENKTLHYHQENVHDFAWFADKRFHVLKDETQLEVSGKKIRTWAMFTNNNADLWLDAPGYLSDAVRYYSLKVGDYPYNQITAVDGLWASGVNMEYPNVTLVGSPDNAIALDMVIAHEVGHNWFYGILGNNEREHAWMDEGLNTLIEMQYMRAKYPGLKLFMGGELGDWPLALAKWMNVAHIPQDRMNALIAQGVQRYGKSQPIDEHSEWFTTVNYGTQSYCKAGVVFDHLRAYVGDTVMDRVMHEYFNQWKFRHPKPEDLQAVAEAEAMQNLNWLFDDLIKTNKKLDYAIAGIKRNYGDSAILKIRNRGQIDAPFSIGSIINDSLVRVDWYSSAEKAEVKMMCDSCDRFVLDPMGNMAEYNRKNNLIRNRDYARKAKGLRLQFLGGNSRPDRVQINWTPTLGWNNNDGFMLGGAIYNNLIPNEMVDYFIMPMYAFKAKALVGQFDLGINISPAQQRWKLRLGLRGKRYNLNHGLPTYTEVQNQAFSTGINFNLKPNIDFDLPIGSPRKGQKLFANTTLHLFSTNYTRNGPQFTVTSAIPQLRFGYDNPNYISSYSGVLDIHHIMSGATKISLTLKAAKRVNSIGTQFKFRTFLGYVAGNSTIAPLFRLSGWTPETDYFRDGYAMNRGATNSDIFHKQVILKEGAFRTSTSLGASNKWLFSSHLNIRPHKFIPIEFFAGFAFFPGPESIYGSTVGKAFEAGLSIILLDDIIEIHLPLFWDKITGDRVRLRQPRFYDRIRFQLNIERIKPRKYLHRQLYGK